MECFIPMRLFSWKHTRGSKTDIDIEIHGTSGVSCYENLLSDIRIGS
jgi:hypothetical protein